MFLLLPLMFDVKNTSDSEFSAISLFEKHGGYK